MRTVRTKVYKFNELSEDAKQTAIEQFSDINVQDYWWENTYEDAAMMGLKINSFNIDRGSYCKGDFTMSAESVAYAIIENHGKDCDTYKTAKEFLIQLESFNTLEDGDEEGDYDNEIEELEEEFEKSLLEDYRIILQKDYEYHTSKEAIIETIEANEYEFYANGKQYF
jgi:hypothetical protein